MNLSNLASSIGEKILNIIDATGKFSIMLGNIFALLIRGKFHLRNTLNQLAFIGTDSMPIALLTSLAVGMVFSLQVADQFIKYGASSMVGGAVSLAVARELAPLFTGVVVAGRVGSAIAAELGSMKVTEQIDALTAMAVSPLYYLALPRVIACIIMVPILAMFSIFIGILGGLLVAVFIKGIILTGFLESTTSFLHIPDLFKAMFKSAIFGIIVSTVGCYQGFNTGEGAEGVGRATTNSVVISLISIFVSNYFLSSVLFGSGKI